MTPARFTPACFTTAYFTADRDGYTPTELARGPWGASVSGTVVGGLPARLTVDLLRPVALAPVTAAAAIRRDGRRIRAADVELHQGGQLAARATVLFARPGAAPPGRVWTPRQAMPPLPHHGWDRTDPPFEMWACHAGGACGRETEWEQDEFRKFGWIREIHPLVEGVPLTPFVRAAMAADVTSAVTNWGTAGLRFINADFTLSLVRLPAGEYIGLASDGHIGHAGLASGSATMFDEQGPIGHTVVTALAQPGMAFRPERS